MPVMLHQPIRRPIFWTLIITFFLIIQSAAQAAQVTIAWDPNDPAPDGYRVFQRVEGQSYDYSSPVWPQAGDDPTQTTCTIANLADDTSYYFVVRAYVGNDESGDSNEINYVTDPAEPTVCTITTSAGPNGTISPDSAMVNAGGTQTFSISPSAGYHIDDVLVDGASVGPVSTYTFDPVNGDHVISAVFSVNTYAISAVADGGGIISPSGSVSVAHGGSQSFTIRPETGYRVADVLVDGQSVGITNSYTFSSVTGSHTIRAIFETTNYIISATAGSNGNITPSGQTSVAYGGDRLYTVSPHSGYRIVDVVVDGASVGVVDTYLFSNVVSDHSISAAFGISSYTIDAFAGTGGSISPSGAVSVMGMSNQTFNVTAQDGYEIDNLIVDGNSLGALNSYTFGQIDANHTIEARFRAVNQLPTADAGPDQVVDEQSLVTLNGLNSNDLDDGIASFEWRQVKGTSVALSSSTDEIVSFTAPNVDMNGEALEFELLITDFSGAQASDRCIVNVTRVNEPPVAMAGADQNVSEGTTVMLNAGGSVDPDDGVAAYQWRQLQGPEVVLLNPDSASPYFHAPDVGPQGVSLTFELSVTDTGGLQDTDSCTVTVTWDNMEPVAVAGSDQQVMPKDVVVLDGSRSMDPDGLDLNYQWRQTFGPPVVLSDATAVSPQFTVPADGFDSSVLTFELTVTDNGGLQGVDACQVSVQAPAQPQDTTPPTVTVDNPVGDRVVVYDRRINIYGRAADDQQVVNVTWQHERGGSGEAIGTTQWRIEGLRLRRGSNTINISAYDAAGNQQTKSIVVELRRKR